MKLARRPTDPPPYPAAAAPRSAVTLGPEAAPGAPTLGAPTPGDGRAVVTWTAPEDPGMQVGRMAIRHG